MSVFLKFKIKAKEEDKELSATNKIIDKILSFIFPIANPDYESSIGKVKTWLLEFVDEHPFPNREIGIDKEGSIIMKMPYKNNYGYWSDNNFKYDDFVERFGATTIDQNEFEKKWKEFGDEN